MNNVLAENIQRFRKEKEMTQEELANILGVTYQAVSKWENAKSAPDIIFLPILADVFECSIDTLFSRNKEVEHTYKINTSCDALPWKDDDVIRGVVCLGQRILTVKEPLVDKFTFEVIGEAKAVKSECNVSVNGSVNGGCKASNSINIDGDVNGGIFCGANISIGGNHAGGVNCGANVSCGGNIDGGINCGSSVSCGTLKARGVNCGGSIAVDGDFNAETVKIKNGDVVCNTFKCDNLKGNVKVKTKE
ncbi:MAG: helix-turn-helix domain-containing protein [Ruminococcaceae bacterium]|nr:helix-turn-helix domain-containing protein [Oscillospiraceae bacterium]